MSQTILYARVSTTDQTTAHQIEQARKAGYQIDDVITDEGVSGVTTRFADRPGAARLFDRLRHGDTLVVRWVDRLGRNYDDVTQTIRALMQRGVVIRTVINSFTFDGATDNPVEKAVRDALIGFMAASAQAQAEATKSAQRAGIDHARNAKDGGRKYRGKKPSYTRQQYDAIRSALSTATHTVSAIARNEGVSRQTVLRIRDEPMAAEAALARWGVGES